MAEAPRLVPSQLDRLEIAVAGIETAMGSLARDQAVLRADIAIVRNEQRRLADTFVLAQGRIPERSPSHHDFDELEERTEGGTRKWAVAPPTPEQIEAIADARAKAMFASMEREATRDAAAAPILFLKGPFVAYVAKGVGLVITLAIGGMILAWFSGHWK